MKQHTPFVLFSLLFLWINSLNAQSRLEYHGPVSVLCTDAGTHYRFLKGGNSEDTLTDTSTYLFAGYEKGDTVAWQYIESEDQLYIAAWNPKKQAKKHNVKFAIAWRVTSGNPRYGNIKIPGNLKFEGFGAERAYFSQIGKPGRMALFFASKYISGEYSVEYTLKIKPFTGNQEPIYEYAQYAENVIDVPGGIINPFGPTERRKREEREEFTHDSALSRPLQALKIKYKSMPKDTLWNSVRYELKSFAEGFYWEDYVKNERDFTQTYIFIEEKYIQTKKLNGILISSHPELSPDKNIFFEPFYQQNGVLGWKITCRTLPMLHLKLGADLPENTPVLIIDKETPFDRPVSQYFAPETFYPNDSFIREISQAKNPADRVKELWAEYALDHGIACTLVELKTALVGMYTRLGLQFESWTGTSPSDTEVSGIFTPKYQDIFVVIITPDYAPKISLRKEGNYKWNDLTFTEWDNLKGQNFKILSERSSFAETVEVFEYKLQAESYAQTNYVLFFSQPPEK